MRTLIEPGVENHLPFARRKLADLEFLRKAAGAPLLSKNYLLDDGTEIRVVTFEAGGGVYDQILIRGGGEFDILLTNGKAIWGYDSVKDKIRLLLSGEVGSTLSQAEPDSCDTELKHVQKKRTRLTGSEALVFDNSTPLANYNLAAYRVGPAIYVNGKEITQELVTLPDGDWQELLMVQRQIGAEKFSPQDWSLMNGPELWQIPPNSPWGAGKTWTWTPRIWFPDPANPFEIPGELHYGYHASPIGPASEITVDFGCLLEDRGGGGIGYCETLVSVIATGETTNHLLVSFMDSLWEAPRNWYFDQQLGTFGSRFFQHSFYTSSPAAVFTIDYKDDFPEATTLEVSWWSAVPDTTEVLQGIVARTSTGEFAVHRRTGYAAPLYRGSGYIGHSVSLDGRTLAVFTGGEEIERVIVFDLVAGTLLRDSSKVAGHAFLSAQIIPREIQKEKQLGFDNHASAVVSDLDPDRIYGESLFGMYHPWPTTDGATASGWKIVIEGNRAVGKLWSDDCWETASYSLFEGAEPEIPQEIFEVSTPELEQYGRATFTPEGLPQPVGGGLVVERERGELSVNTDAFDCLFTDKWSKPPLIWDGAVEYVDGCWKIAPQDDVCAYRVKVTDACGYIGQQEYPAAHAPLSLSVGLSSGVVTTSSVAVAAGGIPPYRYSISCGTINQYTGAVTDLTGCCGTGSVSVSDTCGNTTSIAVRFPVGVWVKTYDEWASASCGSLVPINVTCTVYPSDTEKIIYQMDREYYPGGSNYPSCNVCSIGPAVILSQNPCTGDPVYVPPDCHDGTEVGKVPYPGEYIYFKCFAWHYRWECP